MCGLKRKALEDELAELKKNREVLTEVFASLQKDADQLAEKDGNKSNTLMAQIITKSNTLRRRLGVGEKIDASRFSLQRFWIDSENFRIDSELSF